MSPDFEYFFRATPDPSKDMYALYDVLDGHFLIQSDNYDNLYRLMIYIWSKTKLDIVKLPKSNLDNSQIDQWYIKNLPPEWFNDPHYGKRQFNLKRHRDQWTIQNITLGKRTNFLFDEFKTDLQKQLFFFYHYIDFLNQDFDSNLADMILRAVELCTNYNDAKDTMLDSISISSQDSRMKIYTFLRRTGLFYE
jgi:hypothetical protein